MSKLMVCNHVTLDGVMQAPAAPDEDRSGGFAHGGWAMSRNDEVMGRFMGEKMAGGEGTLLLGRRTYENMAAFWPRQGDDNPYAAVINRTRKYVVSRTSTGPLEWHNSVLLEGDVAEAVRELKQTTDLTVLGSGNLIQTLLRHGLVDGYLLLIHPLVLGTGKRLFPDGVPADALRLTDSVTTTTGVIIAVYEDERGAVG
ncbi:dihydrofolate reductase family protein [Allorhizocola rhizosphaerae]|uniref:dihydrofolate reductase family protein n=1 Tax=Allorhizocola rhizosphaerae TaxID=1872709 RepID=UPI000E3B96CE|nr:dihydrofolate reductase family protein [Allorhizocola rhizosphaerae]